jgi:hypothetical protein
MAQPPPVRGDYATKSLRCASGNFRRQVLGKRYSVAGCHAALASPLTKTQAMHDTPHVIGIVAHPETRKNSVGETRGGPSIRVEAGGTRTCAIHLCDIGKLSDSETTGTTGSAAFPQRFHAFPT